MTYEINFWSITGNPNPYCPPELQTVHLSGAVTGHPRFEDGERITTSPIVGFDPDTQIVTTRSGSQYKLGLDVSPSYLQWLREQGYEFDPDHPRITIHGGD